MFGLFKKRNTSLSRQVLKIAKKPQKDFQLDVLRDGNPDFQIIKQRMLKGFDSNIKIEDPLGFAILISFNLKTLTGEKNHDRFKECNIFEVSRKVNIPDNDIVFYTIKTDNNSSLVLDYISQIQTQVYGYTDNTYYYFKYKEI